MEADKICATNGDLKVLKHHGLIVDPNGLLAWGVSRSTAVLSTRAVIIRPDHCHSPEDEEHMLTDEVPHECNSLMWAACHNEARSGVVLAVADLDPIGGEGRRLVVAAPPYKKRTNFKSEAEALTYVQLEDVAELKAIIPARGLDNLDGFIKSVSTHYPCTHTHLHPSLLVQLKIFKEVHITKQEELKNWHLQGWPGRERVCTKAYDDKVQLLIKQQAGG